MITRNSFRIGVYIALLFSILGLLLVCLPILGLHYTVEFANRYFPQVAVGYGAMILIIELIGVPLRSVLTRYWAGALFAFCLFIVGATFGSATSMILYEDMDFHSYVVKPLFWLGFYGFIPASVIGLIGTKMLRTIKKM